MLENNNTSLREKAAAGGRWTAVSAIASTLIQLAQLAILGRLLNPADFGLMAMLLVVIGGANLLADLGTSSFLIQTKNLSGRLFSVLLTICISGALCLAGLIVFVSPFVADYYKTPILANLLPALGVVVVASSISQPFYALLQRKMKFRKIAILEIISWLVGLLVAVVLALTKQGVWALIGGQIAFATVKAVMGVIMGSSLIQFEWKIDKHDLMAALHFGKFQMGERLINFAGCNVDKVLVGRTLGNTALGIYSIAYQLAVKPYLIVNPIFTRVALPLLSQVQDDNVRLSRGYLQIIQTIALITFPIYLFMILSSYSLVYFLLGKKWIDAVDLVAILGGVGFIFSLGNPIGNLLLAKGRADLGFYYNIFVTIIYALFIYGGSHFGVKGVAYGFLMAEAGVIFPFEFILRWHLVRMTPWAYLKAIGNIVIGTLCPLIIGSLVLSLCVSRFGRLGMDVIVGLIAVAVYFAYLVLTERFLLQKTVQLILKK